MEQPNILCIIPARGGSKGVLRKNIRDVAGKPLIAWAIESALTSGVMGKLVVSTEDKEIASVAQKWGAEIVERPPELAGDAVLTEPVMLHALEEVERGGFVPEYVSLIQCTSPFLTPQVIKKAVETLVINSDRYDSCGTFYEPHYAFRWKKTEDDRFESEYPIEKRPRRQDLHLEYPYCGAGAFYVVKTDVFKKTKNRYGGTQARIAGVVVPEEDALQIDSEYHLWLAGEQMKRKLAEGKR